MNWRTYAVARSVDLAPGAHLFRQGAAVHSVFSVIRGRVQLVRPFPSGARISIHVAGPGDAFAEAALFSDTYHCDAVALGPARVAAYPAAQIRAAIEADPALALGFCAQLARQVRDLRAQLELRDTGSAVDRVLGWIALNADSAGVARLDQPWTQIAEQIGLTRETVYRALATLERQDRIMRSAGEVRLAGQSR